MADLYTPQQLEHFTQFINTCPWNDKVPGGFLTNSPQRLVNSFGTGATINPDSTLNSDGWPSTYWTAAIKHSNMTIETIPHDLPDGLRTLVPVAREMFEECIDDAVITPSTFNIAVCNKYCDPMHEIKAHTDCNDWYPHESSLGPVFASITVYPDTIPSSDDEYARFQVKLDGTWHDLILPHMSIMIMPSNIEHRVMKHKHGVPFHSRINITLRSTYDKTIDPLRSIQAVSNHARYYRIPYACHYPCDIDATILQDVVSIFNDFNIRHGCDNILCVKSDSTSARTVKRRSIITQLKQGKKFRVNNNTVLEACMLALSKLNA